MEICDLVVRDSKRVESKASLQSGMTTGGSEWLRKKARSEKQSRLASEALLEVLGIGSPLYGCSEFTLAHRLKEGDIVIGQQHQCPPGTLDFTGIFH